MEDLEEKWAQIDGYDHYFISNMGRVKSTKGKNEIFKVTPINKKGYVWVHLSNKGKINKFFVHRLVGAYFIPNPLNLPQINHIGDNPDKTDNRYFMLELCTGLENIRHAYKNGLFPIMTGEKNGMTKLTEKEVLEIRSSSLTRKELCEIYKVHKVTIARIINRKSWAHI